MQKFVEASALWPTSWPANESSVIVILSAYNYWADHETELKEWLSENDAGKLEGMIVTFKDTESFFLFKMRWS